MPRLRLLAVTTVLAVAALTLGETVYLRDGRKLIGKVTRRDGKVKVEMAYGTVVVDESDVIYVGQGEPKTRPSAPDPIDSRRPTAKPRPAVEWNPTKATLAEAMLFMAERRAELLPEAMSHGVRQELEQWRQAAHDRKRKAGANWLTRDQQDHRRAEFDKRVRPANEKARRAARAYERTDADRVRKRRLRTQARNELLAAARLWPDEVIRNFLIATQELRYDSYAKAEEGFRRCVEAQPLVAAFHQGRGYALLGLKRHVEALEEFILCVKLRDDTYQTLKLLEDAMKEVPGSSIDEPAYAAARELLDRYEKPKYEYRSYGKGIAWLMPGGTWASRDDTLFTPAYDRLVARQALAVPVTEDGLLLADKNALAAAHLVYVEVGPNQFVRAETSRQVSRSSRTDRQGIPLATIAVRGVTFVPVDLEKPAPVKPDAALTIRAVNVYRQMGTEIRQGEARVASVEDGRPNLASALLPGEAVGAAFADGRFAGFLAARDDPEVAGCGQSTFIKPADLAEWIGRLKKYLKSRPSYRSARGPNLKPDAARIAADGQVFLVHILLGEKPPPKLIK